MADDQEGAGTGNALKELRARLDARKAEGEAKAPPKIVSIKTRQAYVPEVKPKGRRPPKVDQESVEAVERLLARLKAGEVEGVMSIVSCKGARKGYFDLSLRMPPGRPVGQEALRYLGILELMRGDLVELAEFGDVPDDVVLMEGEDE